MQGDRVKIVGSIAKGGAIMAIKIDTGWDLSVSNGNGQLILTVEVKRKINASPEWAAQLRHNLLAHGDFPKAPYFLMVFPDKFYLWTAPGSQANQGAANYIIDAQSILQPYFERAGVTADQISGPSLELIVASWLGEVINSEQLPDKADASQQWLMESGLYEALTGGQIEYEAAA